MRSAIMQIAKIWINDHPVPKRSLASVELETVQPIVSLMDTLLRKPDDKLIKKNQTEEKALYFIAKGECFVDFHNGDTHRQTTS